MRLVKTIYSKGENYAANIIYDDDRTLNGKPSYFFFGDMDNDVDGTPHWRKDPCGAPGTTLSYQGKPVNGDIIPGIVVPPELINMTGEIVMGCIATVEYHGLVLPAVVFDSGPHNKLGEGTPALLKALGAPALDNGNGGIDEQLVLYRIWPGVPARLEIKGEIYQFDLQHA